MPAILIRPFRLFLPGWHCKDSSGKKIGGVRQESSGSSSGRTKMSQSLSFARSNFSPSIGHRKTHYSFSGSLALKTAWIPFLQTGAAVGINFSTEDFSDEDKEGRFIPVVGFDHQGDISNYNQYYTGDFSREKDGQITRQSIMLASVHGMYDSYSSSGQGLAGYFRPHRHVEC